MCRALKVLCVAEDPVSLAALKQATVGAEWELAPGAISTAAALTQLEEMRPHVLVVFGAFEDLVRGARDRFPGLRVVADRELPGADVVAATLDEVRGAILARARPGGPVR